MERLQAKASVFVYDKLERFKLLDTSTKFNGNVINRQKSGAH